MAACTIRDDFRSKLRRQAVVTVFVTTDTSARDSKFARESYAFMTPGTRISSHRGGSIRCCLFNGRGNSMDAVTVSANRRSRHATRHGLSMNTLHELSTFGLVAFTTGPRDVDLRNWRSRVGSGKDVVTIVAVSTNGR